MLVTPSGIVMLIRLVQPVKADFPILVTGLPSMVAGMVNAPDAFLSHPVMVTVPSLISYFKLGLRGTSSTGLVSATGFSPHPTARMVIAINSKFFIALTPNTPLNSSILQNPPKIITGTVAGGLEIPEQWTMNHGLLVIGQALNCELGNRSKMP